MEELKVGLQVANVPIGLFQVALNLNRLIFELGHFLLGKKSKCLLLLNPILQFGMLAHNPSCQLINTLHRQMITKVPQYRSKYAKQKRTQYRREHGP